MHNRWHNCREFLSSNNTRLVIKKSIFKYGSYRVQKVVHWLHSFVITIFILSVQTLECVFSILFNIRIFCINMHEIYCLKWNRFKKLTLKWTLWFKCLSKSNRTDFDVKVYEFSLSLLYKHARSLARLSHRHARALSENLLAALIDFNQVNKYTQVFRM